MSFDTSFFDERKMGRGSDLNWRLPPKHDHNDTLPAKPKPTKTGNPDEVSFGTLFIMYTITLMTHDRMMKV